MQAVMRGLERMRRLAQQLGPYLMLEILLPGGTLFALLLLLYRRRATLVPAWVLVPSWRPRWTGNAWWPEWLSDLAVPMSNSGCPNRL